MKCKGIWLGSLKDYGLRKAYGINWTGNPVKVLGIYIGHNKEKNYELNWNRRLTSIENLLSKWSRADLPLFTKINFIKTFALSKMIFPATMLSIDDNIIKKLNVMFYRFVWGKRDKITRSSSCNKISAGGLGMHELSLFF